MSEGTIKSWFGWFGELKPDASGAPVLRLHVRSFVGGYEPKVGDRVSYRELKAVGGRLFALDVAKL